MFINPIWLSFKIAYLCFVISCKLWYKKSWEAYFYGFYFYALLSLFSCFLRYNFELRTYTDWSLFKGILRALGRCLIPLQFALGTHTKSGHHSVSILACGFINPDVSINLIPSSHGIDMYLKILGCGEGGPHSFDRFRK